MKIPLSFLILAATQTLALASVTDELFDQLKTELRAEIKAQKDNGREEPSRTTQMLMQVVEMRARGGEEDGNFLASLEGLEVISANDKVQQIAKALATELRKEQEQTEAARAERNEHTLGDAVKTLLDAKTAKDLDAPLIAVGNLVHENNDGYGSGYSKNQKLRTQGAQVQQFWEYLRQWQNYLSDIEGGDTKAARQQLQNLSNSERDFSGFIPRSTLLEKLKTLEKATGTGDEDPHETTSADREKRLDAILDGIKSLDDLPGALQAADAIRRQGGGTASTEMAISQLRTTAQVYGDLKQGFATNFILPSYGTSANGNSKVEELRRDLLMFALPRILGLAPEDQRKPDENFSAFFQRIFNLAKEKSDWPAVGRIMDVAMKLNVAPIASQTDNSALTNFLGGLNQERAKQYMLAVASYETCLKSGSQIVPAEQVGEHLEKLKREHPQEYELGVQLALAPPARTDPFGRPMILGQPMGFPRVPSAQQPAEQAISVPAAPPKSPAPAEPANK